MSINRRKFIQNISVGALAVGAGIPLSMCKNDGSDILTILHTNDMHSQIDPFPKDNPRYHGSGGFARIAKKVDDIRKVRSNILLLDAGDIFQGTPYFNFFKGELEIKLMNEMGYDASTFGNHEFDNGIHELAKQVSRASFPFINCNYDLTETPLNTLHKPYIILNRGNKKIGITGVGIKLYGLADPQNMKNLKYHDPVSNADKVARHLKEKEKCDMVICLSHLGYKYNFDKVSDVVMAENVKYIDLIIGGHTHTFMKQPDIIKNKHGKQVIVHQAGWGGLRLGVLQFKFPDNGGEPQLV